MRSTDGSGLEDELDRGVIIGEAEAAVE